MQKATQFLKTYIRHAPWPMVLLCLLASAYSVVLVYSVAKTSGTGSSGYLFHSIASAAGLVIALVIASIDYENLCSLWPIYAGVGLILMLLTYTPLALNVVGTDDTAWLYIPLGAQRITFQPSELLKIVFIITFSKHLCTVKDKLDRLSHILLLCLHGAVPALMVFKQGDDGTALVFVCIFLTMMFAARLPKRYYVIAGGGVAAALPLLWFFFLDDVKKARFLCLFQVEEYRLTTGWQQYLGLMAMGSGQLTGLGFGEGGAHALFARNNDFIFTVAGEEFGFIGSILLLILLLGILSFIFHCARTARDAFGSFLCVGMLGYIGFQSIINLGMVTRLIPVIGITLPFFSAGGSSVLTLYLGVGLVMSVYLSSRKQHKNAIFARS